jgi:hypothetical protein
MAVGGRMIMAEANVIVNAGDDKDFIRASLKLPDG